MHIENNKEYHYISTQMATVKLTLSSVCGAMEQLELIYSCALLGV